MKTDENIMNQKKVFLQTMGCRLNQSETAVIGETFKRDGYEIVSKEKQSDVVVINTCTVTAMADAKARHAIRSALRHNPKSLIAVVGCYSQIGYKAIAEISGVDLIIGQKEKMNVLDYLPREKQDRPIIIRDQMVREDFSIDVIGQAHLTTRANLKIQDGCDFMCTFCIIPFARGRSRSRDFQNLYQEAKVLAQQGFKEIILTGVNIGTFTSEGKDLVDIVDALNEVQGLKRVRISSIEPTTIPDAILDRMKDEEHVLLPYLHIPLQSASDDTLKAMKRKYSSKEYFDYLDFVKQKVPNISIGTDVMVGFPGETDEHFEKMYQDLLKSPLMYFHVFSYSLREGTLASKYAGQVSSDKKKRRSALLRVLSELKKNEYYRSAFDREVDVLFESQENGYWFGFSEEYIRVGVLSDQNLENVIAKVKLHKISGDFAEGNLV